MLDFSGEISRQSFISTLNRANQLTRHIHELCHHGGRSLFGISVVDAASFFFAVDQDKSGDLSLDEIKAGLQEINGEVGHGKVTNEQIDEFLEWLGKILKQMEAHVDFQFLLPPPFLSNLFSLLSLSILLLF